MIIDKRNALLRLKRHKLIFTLLLIAMVIALLINYMEFVDISRIIYYVLAAFVQVYVLVFVYLMIKNPDYIYFSDEGSKLIFRYFQIFTFKRRNQAIEIPKHSLEKYEIEESILGLVTKIIVFQRTSKGVAKYPPINISFLSKRERNNMILSLNKCVSIKK